jgi:hypothetical protein
MIVMTMDSPTVSDTNDYSLYADAVVGSNGDPYCIPGYDLGTDPSTSSGADITWDQSVANGDLSAGFDTGNCNFLLDSNLGSGTNSLEIGGNSGSALTYDTDGSQTIGSVEIVAGAEITGTAAWKNLSVSFFQGGTLQETQTFGQGPSVDTTDPSTGGSAEQTMTVTPVNPNDDHVIVSGTFRLTSPAGVTPGPTDLFCKVFVMPPAA